MVSRILRERATDLEALADLLDGLDPGERVAQMEALSAKEVKALYHHVAEAEPLGLDFFVPEGISAGQEVIHQGWNSLPSFRRFQKRFVRQREGDEFLVGYNAQKAGRITGPGYFLAGGTAHRDAWLGRGEVVIDYHRVPEAQRGIPSSWPDVIPNHKGLQVLIYHKTRDFMRRVSSHVSVGAAFKAERDSEMGAYFILIRMD